MIKIRLHGEIMEIKKYIQVLKKYFEILNESDIYEDRAPSKYARAYLDIRYHENSSPEDKLYTSISKYKSNIFNLIKTAISLAEKASSEEREEDARYFSEQAKILDSVQIGLEQILEDFDEVYLDE